MTLWAIGALWFDFPVKILRHGVAIVYAIGMVVLVANVRGQWRKIGSLAGGFVLVLALLAAAAALERPPLAARCGRRRREAEIDGNHVTLHNVRNCEYRNGNRIQTYAPSALGNARGGPLEIAAD